MKPSQKLLLLFLFVTIACNAFAPQRLLMPSKTITAMQVITHPDGPLYAGDRVSFEVLAPSGFQTDGKQVRISLPGKSLGDEKFAPFGMGQRNEATFFWVWDTSELQPGDYVLTFSILPGTASWDEKFTLRNPAELPASQRTAAWKSTSSGCCELHYISDTDSEKDLESLKSMADAQASDVERRMGVNFTAKIPITFLPRTLGHGGFTSNGIYLSYLRNNYAGSTTAQVMHHEMVHWLDGQLGGKLRPSMLQEGLAVYLSDGHFKVEPILPRAAALLDLGWYVPLRKLADSFYLSQHEVGYAEAAALVSYMVKTFGWDDFNAFYRAILPVAGGSETAALDAALLEHYHINLDQLEKDFIHFLRQQSFDENIRTDLKLTVSFYDTVRRYQVEMDPSAYFLYAWLPDIPEMRQRGIVADLLRHPVSFYGMQIERLLVACDADLRAGNYGAAGNNIRAVNMILNIVNFPGE
ncbi:MAG TPA: hypothetical protein VGK00_08665 [Anaerolineales bacterium]